MPSSITIPNVEEVFNTLLIVDRDGTLDFAHSMSSLPAPLRNQTFTPIKGQPRFVINQTVVPMDDIGTTVDCPIKIANPKYVENRTKIKWDLVAQNPTINIQGIPHLTSVAIESGVIPPGTCLNHKDVDIYTNLMEQILLPSSLKEIITEAEFYRCVQCILDGDIKLLPRLPVTWTEEQQKQLIEIFSEIKKLRDKIKKLFPTTVTRIPTKPKPQAAANPDAVPSEFWTEIAAKLRE